MSSQRSTVTPYKIVDNVALVDAITATTSCRYLDNISFQIEWNTNTSGTGYFTVQGSITPPNAADTAIWSNLDVDTVLLSGTSGNALLNLSGLAFDKVRILYTQTVLSTGGKLNVWTMGKGV